MTAAFPSPLQAGHRIVVLAPASAPRDVAELQRGLDALQAMEYKVELDYDLGAQHGYLAAPDDQRLDAFNRVLRRDDIRAILCVRGGYGALRLLSRLDYTAAREHPKLLVGYSDITALQWALYTKAGWTSLSGPVLTEWHQLDADAVHCLQLLAQGEQLASLQLPNADPLQPLTAGAAEGTLIGGNLSVCSRLVGTPYAPDLSGAILFLEDVGEAPYRVDRMLAHLALAGWLDDLAGVVLGRFTTGSVDGPSLTLDQVFRDYFGHRSYPVATGLCYGHFMPRSTIPIGVQARLTVTNDEAQLGLLGPVTR